jgi:hypothetical protein
MKARKKPVVIEFIQYDGLNIYEVKQFCGENLVFEIYDAAWQVGKGAPMVDAHIKTLEGNMKVSTGDYIIKGVNGEFYPCKPDIFEKTYDILEETEKIDSPKNKYLFILRAVSVVFVCRDITEAFNKLYKEFNGDVKIETFNKIQKSLNIEEIIELFKELTGESIYFISIIGGECLYNDLDISN